jgi:hypothetical protein
LEDVDEFGAEDFEAGAGLEGAEGFEGVDGGDEFDGENEAGEIDHLLELEGGGHPHRDEVLLVAGGGDGAWGGGIGEDAEFGDEGGGGDLEHHEPGFEAGVPGEEGGEAFVERGIDEAVDTAFADAGEGAEGEGGVVEGEGEGLTVEVAAGEGVVVEDEGVIGGGVQFDVDDAADFGEGIGGGAVDLGGAAEGVGVLDVAAGLVGGADLGAFEPQAEAGGAGELAGVGAGEMDALVEGGGRATEGVEGEGAGGVGGIEEVFGIEEGETASGEHGLGAVDEGDAFLGLEGEGCDAGGGEGIGTGEALALVEGGAFSNEDESDMGEGGEVAAGADAAAGRSDGGDAMVEEGEEAFGDLGADAGEAPGEDVGADEHDGADDGFGEGVADAAGVGAEDVVLKGFEAGGIDADIGELAEAGVDAVDGAVLEGEGLDDGAGLAHALEGVGGELDLFAGTGHGVDLFEAEALPVESDHPHTLS